MSTSLFATSYLPPSPWVFQHNCEKYSAPPHQNQYNSKPCTIPYKCDASAMSNPPPENQQAPHLSQNKNNGKIKPSSD